MQKKIIIGLATFKRPQMLSKTLESLKQQKLIPGVEIALVLVDNDAEKSAYLSFQQIEGHFPFNLHYFNESAKGIVSARNRIVDEAIKLEGDFLAFLDDDEVAAPDWLFHLYAGLQQWKADAVSGFSLQKTPACTPSWISRGGFFTLSSYPTGTLRKSASTRNVMFDLQRLCAEWSLRFHPALNLAGSSDTFFFEEAHIKGARIVWISEAVVVENIPASRLTASWILARRFRAGNSYVIRERLRRRRLSSLLLLPRALVDLVAGLIFFVVTVPFGKHVYVWQLGKVYKAMGCLAGVFGYKYLEYEAAHGG